MAHKTTKILLINDIPVPVIIYKEQRRSIRAAIGVKEVHLRIPASPFLIPSEEPLKWVEEWLREKYETSPEIFERFRKKTYRSGQIIHTTQKDYPLEILKNRLKSMRGKIIGHNIIRITYPLSWPEEYLHEDIGTMISKIIGSNQKSWVESRLKRLYNTHFSDAPPYTDFKLKLNRTKWGSCSRNRSIIISTRLLKAPVEMLDYVLIHELAHLIHHNHSKAFWQRVAKAMPDYKQKERWLSENSHLCDF